MTDAGGRYPGVDDPVHAIPRHAMPLAAPPERAKPRLDHVVSERRQATPVGRHGMVGEVACHDAFQPLSLIGDAIHQFIFGDRFACG
jgi:hypothetical protein